MGAHVWGPAFLRDHLLTDGRLSGWTPDWYAGFPAYQFYMVVPSLLIVALDVGRLRRLAHDRAARGGGGLVVREHPRSTGGGAGRLVAAAPWSSSCSASSCPYGTAFKLVTVLGRAHRCPCARTPSAGWPTCRSRARRSCRWRPCSSCSTATSRSTAATSPPRSRASSPSRSACRSRCSTSAWSSRGLRTGQHRALAAVLLALTGLCHLIPAFFALAGTVVIALMRRPARPHRGLARVRAPGGRADQRLLGAAVLVAARLRERHGLGEAALRRRPRTASGPCAARCSPSTARRTGST